MSNTLNFFLGILFIIILSSCALSGGKNSPSNSQIAAAQYSNNKCIRLSDPFIAPANEIIVLGKFIISRDNEPVNTKRWRTRPAPRYTDCKQLYYKNRVAIDEVFIAEAGGESPITIKGEMCRERPLVHIYPRIRRGFFLQQFYHPFKNHQSSVLKAIKTAIKSQCGVLPEVVDIRARAISMPNMKGLSAMSRVREINTILRTITWNEAVFENIYEGTFFPNKKLDIALVDAKPDIRVAYENRFFERNRVRRPRGVDPRVAEEMALDFMQSLPAINTLIENAQCASARWETPNSIPSWCDE